MPRTEVKIGNNIHFYKDPQSGFWINPLAQDPMSATLIQAEVVFTLRDGVKQINELITKLKNRAEEIEQAAKDLEE